MVYFLSPGISDVKQHDQTGIHQDNIRKQNEQSMISQFMVKQDLGERQLEEDVVNAEALFCHFLVEHNLPFALCDHVGDLFRKMFKDSKIAQQFKCARTKATSIVKQALGPQAMKRTLTAMKNGPFSLLMDESNDICNEKDVALLVRYFDEDKTQVVVRFFGIPVCNIATGANLYTVVEEQFCHYDIPWENLVCLIHFNRSHQWQIHSQCSGGGGGYQNLKQRICMNLSILRREKQFFCVLGVRNYLFCPTRIPH